MFIPTFNKTFPGALTAAIVAASFLATPAFADGGPQGGVSTISSTTTYGTTTTIRSRNGAETYTRTRTKNGKVINKKKIKKNLKAFITIFNPDGTSRTVTTPSKRRDSATRHFPDGSRHTVFHPTNQRSTFITIHFPDGSSNTVGNPGR